MRDCVVRCRGFKQAMPAFAGGNVHRNVHNYFQPPVGFGRCCSTVLITNTLLGNAPGRCAVPRTDQSQSRQPPPPNPRATKAVTKSMMSETRDRRGTAYVPQAERLWPGTPRRSYALKLRRGPAYSNRADAIRWAELRDYTTAPDPAPRHAIEDMFRVYVETVGQLRALLGESAYHELLSICHTTRQAPPGRSN
jgi:hypothetical protein